MTSVATTTSPDFRLGPIRRDTEADDALIVDGSKTVKRAAIAADRYYCR